MRRLARIQNSPGTPGRFLPVTIAPIFSPTSDLLLDRERWAIGQAAQKSLIEAEQNMTSSKCRKRNQGSGFLNIGDPVQTKSLEMIGQ
jgi:hypothetical protein